MRAVSSKKGRNFTKSKVREKNEKMTLRWKFSPAAMNKHHQNEEYKVDQEGVVLKFSSSALKGIMMPLFSRQDTHQLLGRHPNRVVALYLGWF